MARWWGVPPIIQFAAQRCRCPPAASVDGCSAGDGASRWLHRGRPPPRSRLLGRGARCDGCPFRPAHRRRRPAGACDAPYGRAVSGLGRGRGGFARSSRPRRQPGTPGGHHPPCLCRGAAERGRAAAGSRVAIMAQAGRSRAGSGFDGERGGERVARNNGRTLSRRLLPGRPAGAPARERARAKGEALRRARR